MFQKILVPTDGSRCSLEAARIAGELAEAHQGEVVPLVAVEFQFVHGDDVPDDISAAMEQRIREAAGRAMEGTTRAISATGGSQGEPKFVEANPVDAILREAEEGEYDLIVMGSRGVSLDRGHERLVGSVTERVLHRTPCPVMVIRAEPRP